MRNFTKSELNILNSDIKAFEKFLMINSLYTEEIENKYIQIKFGIEEQSILKGANGITNLDRSIAISDSIFMNNVLRPRTLFHEIGHALFGINHISKEKRDEILEEIVTTQVENSDELTLSQGVYLQGVQCLEEYLAEKFSQIACFYAIGLNIPQKLNYSNPSICADYKYDSTFKSNYGIFESQCDAIISRIFGNLTNAINSAFKEEYFINFFRVDNKVLMMQLLGNLGQIYGATQIFAGHNNNSPAFVEYKPREIKKLLITTSDLVNNLPQNSIQQTKRN